MTHRLPATGRPAASRRLRHPWRSALTGVAAVVVAGAAVFLIVKGSQSTPPPAAPSPERTYSSSAPPAELLPGDIIPPATGALPQSSGEESEQIPRIIEGNATRPPRHAGPWTFEGPSRLFIQSLGVEAPIDDVGADQGAMIIPDDIARVGRWESGATLDGAEGTVLVAGHVNIAGQGRGALYHLVDIQPGAVIVTTDSAGYRTSWRVTSLESVNKKALPADIFAASGPRRLVLVTCGGELLHINGPNGGYNTYENNVVVRADPVA